MAALTFILLSVFASTINAVDEPMIEIPGFYIEPPPANLTLVPRADASIRECRLPSQEVSVPPGGTVAVDIETGTGPGCGVYFTTTAGYTLTVKCSDFMVSDGSTVVVKERNTETERVFTSASPLTTVQSADYSIYIGFGRVDDDTAFTCSVVSVANP